MLGEPQERLSIAAGSRRRSSRAAPPAPSPGRSTRSESGRGTKGVRASVASSIVSIGGNAIAGVVNYLFAVFLGEGTAVARRVEVAALILGAARTKESRVGKECESTGRVRG